MSIASGTSVASPSGGGVKRGQGRGMPLGRLDPSERSLVVAALEAFGTRFAPESVQSRHLHDLAAPLLDHCGAAALVDAIDLALDLEGEAGRAVANEGLLACARALRWVDDAQAFRQVTDALRQVGHRAPESVGALARSLDTLLARLAPTAFARFAGAGLDLHPQDGGRRLAFFALQDPMAETLVQREAAAVPLSALEPRLKGLVTALWTIEPVIRPAPAGGAQTARRSSFDGRLFFVPESYRGFLPEATTDLQRAAVLHMGAHLAYGLARREMRGLKPLQVALISLLEDARAEYLAMAEFPGLARLWRPFHVARPEGGTTEALLARLSRALADPDWADDDPFIQKARTGFREAMQAPGDPAILRHLGGALGNDLGQMRLQFNAKTYAPEPAYRDDNLGLWDFPPPPPDSADAAEVTVSIRLDQREADNAPSDRTRPDDGGGNAAPVRPAEPDPGLGQKIASLPEWDHVSARARSDWVSVMAYPPRLSPARIIDRLLDARSDVIARTSALMRSARAGQPTRLRRQAEGDRLDLDAVLRARIDFAGGKTPDTRVYESRVLNERDLSLLLLMDISESTKDTINGSQISVFSLLREAVSHLAASLSEVGDPFALAAFNSDGRQDLRFSRLKTFAEPFGTRVKERLAGLRPGLSTRMGGAIRMACRDIEPMATYRRLVLVVTDGEPSDVDVSDPRYLVEDARRAVQEAGARGIDVFCVALDRSGDAYLSRIFGRQNVVQIDDVSSLPDRLPKLYLRLTR
jgi:nitric oxide reductase NorD protein